jgi:hypothetical protein
MAAVWRALGCGGSLGLHLDDVKPGGLLYRPKLGCTSSGATDREQRIPSTMACVRLRSRSRSTSAVPSRPQARRHGSGLQRGSLFVPIE